MSVVITALERRKEKLAQILQSWEGPAAGRYHYLNQEFVAMGYAIDLAKAEYTRRMARMMHDNTAEN